LIEPNVNFTFRQIKSNVNQHYQYKSIYYSSGVPYASGNSYYSLIDNEQKSATLTPSLSLSYADAVSIQGGFEYFLRFSNVNTFTAGNSAYTRPKLFPFVTVAGNILPSEAGNNPNTKLMVFASFAKSMTNMSDGLGTLRDGSNPTTNNAAAVGYLTGGYYFYYSSYNPYQTYDQLQGGATLSLLKSRLSISYNYNVQKHSAPIGTVIFVPGTGSTVVAANYTIYPDQRLDMHRLGLDFKAYHTEKFSWTTAANFTVVKRSANLAAIGSSPGSFYYYPLNGNITAGGFINRFTYKSFTAGLDVLYRINEDTYAVGTGVKGNINSFDLKNIYVGYQLAPKNTKGLEVFVNARNIVQNKQSDITDNRRFYGLGFKLGL